MITPSGIALPALYLYPLNATFLDKHIHLPPGQRVLIGRQTDTKSMPDECNGFFDSNLVLSRVHAQVWEVGGKMYIKDVGSLKGTFVSSKRLSPKRAESEPFELKTNDTVEFGIDIIGKDNKTVVHHKVAARVVCVFTPEDAPGATRAELYQPAARSQTVDIYRELDFVTSDLAGLDIARGKRAPRSFTLFSTEALRNGVIKQRSYTGQYCIPSSIADQPIGDPAMTLTLLNDILGTCYTVQSTPSLVSAIEYLKGKGYDLGMTYGMLRPWWLHDEIHRIHFPSHFECLEREDSERRERVVVNGFVVDSEMSPRRLWDLYSNRVLPSWALGIVSAGDLRSHVQAVSHAWMPLERRAGVSTSINGHKWPIPFPKDLHPDGLRIELLNLHTRRGNVFCPRVVAEYAWLDVLCLRQMGGKPDEERLRPKEWKVDVPTIGTVYQSCATIVVYLNGLGLPFEETDLDNPRHWCNRAWTMQEWCRATSVHHSGIHRIMISLGGITKQSPPFNIYLPLPTETHFTRQLSKRMSVHDARACLGNILNTAAMMCKRHAEREVDKVAGLAYFVCDQIKPVFEAEKGVDDAWSALVSCMAPTLRGQLFFVFPEVGNIDDSKFRWIPSWHQLLDGAEAMIKYTHVTNLGYTPLNERYCPRLTLRTDVGTESQLAVQGRRGLGIVGQNYDCLAVCLSECTVNGLESSNSSSATTNGNGTLRLGRRGTVTFRVRPGKYITFNLTAYHHNSISSSGRYCLLSSIREEEARMWHPLECLYWVVGHLDEEKQFHKVSVLAVDDSDKKENLELCKELGLRRSNPDWKQSSWIRRIRLA